LPIILTSVMWKSHITQLQECEHIINLWREKLLTLCWLASTKRSPKQCRSMRFNCRHTWSNNTWPFVSFWITRHNN